MNPLDIFTDYTLRTVSLGAALLGIVSGGLGSFALLRKQSLMGDAMSHAALPGIALAFLFTGSKAPLVLLLGAAIAGWLGTWFVMQVIRKTRVSQDSAMGIVLSVFFGLGLVLLTFIQKLPTASQAGLDKFLFGQAATLMEKDVITMAVLGLPALLLMGVFWKELKLLSFDREYGDTLGFAMQKMDLLLTAMLVVAIVIGLQTVGVVLMSAMVVAPAAAARQWTDRMGGMVVLASLFGAISGVSGAVLSATMENLPTGPTIVVVLSVVVFGSMIFAPRRGLLFNYVRSRRNSQRLQVRAVLEDLYMLSLQHAGEKRPHPVQTLRAMSWGHGGVERSLRELEERKWVTQLPGGWVLTTAGELQAQQHAGEEKS